MLARLLSFFYFDGTKQYNKAKNLRFKTLLDVLQKITSMCRMQEFNCNGFFSSQHLFSQELMWLCLKIFAPFPLAFTLQIIRLPHVVLSADGGSTPSFFHLLSPFAAQLSSGFAYTSYFLLFFISNVLITKWE